MKTIINATICLLLLALTFVNIAHSIADFNEARTWLDVFKALFWLVVGTVAFLVTMKCLIKKKPIWRIWE